MIRNHKTRLTCLAAAIAMATAACGDHRAPTAPALRTGDAAPSVHAARARARVPTISSLQLSSIYVDIATGVTPIAVTVTNAMDKDFQNIFLKGELRQGNQTPVPATAFLAYCPGPNGTIPPGNCAMFSSINGVSPSLDVGPATYTLKVLQQQANGNMKVLASETVDVVLGRTVIIDP